MKILILNPILYTADNNTIPKVKSIKDTMIYNMCLGFKSLGHKVTLCAAKEFMPSDDEKYEFDVVWHRSSIKKLLPPPSLSENATFSTYHRGLSHYRDPI